jgi:ubiquinone/menaquinone biosynthesis C-methylase UbiE
MKKIDPSYYNKDYYFNTADGFSTFNEFLNKPNPKYKYAMELAKVNKTDVIMDFGCGRGELCVLLNTTNNCKVYGLDYSKDAIEICNSHLKNFREKITDVKFIHLKETRLPFVNDYLDKIFFLSTWEHIDSLEMDIILKEFKRVLKPGGLLIAETSPNKLFFGVGYKYYTYALNIIMNFIFKLIYKKDMKRNGRNPRTQSEQLLHINEQTLDTVKNSLELNGFIGKTFINDWPFLKNDIMLFFYYLVAQPYWLSKKYFGEHIWAVYKKPIQNSN